MPPVLPLEPQDPERLGPYPLLGRLPGVYLAESPTGERVTLRRLAKPLDSRARDAVARIWETAAVGTAHILDVGRDYVVSEYVAGPTLAEEVAERGPLAGTALHRLAIATATALAALHRANLHHGRVRPAKVVLGPDGPRLLNPDRTRPVTAFDEDVWRRPEEEEGPAADVFAWAAMMVFAATGTAPFDAEHDRRLSYGAADLGSLTGPLRDLVADCLAPDPAERPTAEEALLRLLGHSGTLDTALPEPTAPTPSPPPKRRSRVGLLVAAGIGLALVAGAGGYLLTPPPTAPAAATAAPSSPAAAPVATSSVVPTTGLTEVALPDSGGTLYQHPDDPLRLSSYRLTQADGQTIPYVLNGATYTRAGKDHDVAVASPDGRWLATLNEFYLAERDRLDVVFTDRTSGATFSVPTVNSPVTAHYPLWSPDGRTLLLTLWHSETAQRTYPLGFMTVDPVARKATVVETANPEDIAQFLALPEEMRLASMPAVGWTPDGKGVASLYITPEERYGLSLRDLSGRLTWSMHWVGKVTGWDWYSPSGRTLMTSGCEETLAACLWDAATGERRGTVPGRKGGLIGWYDETHLIIGHQDGGVYTVEVIDLTGKPVRVLAELNNSPDGFTQLFFTRK
ncbi:hypothetical protein [Acrocarpospora catenulata]|uniref:hypothetical protein n=1 Tax=Acrocarpospora catenulata TaxID=2836182 RepID=UPI001BD9477C|nr:hypothetical protein [Acrocarpospora catenulata]